MDSGARLLKNGDSAPISRRGPLMNQGHAAEIGYCPRFSTSSLWGRHSWRRAVFRRLFSSVKNRPESDFAAFRGLNGGGVNGKRGF